MSGINAAGKRKGKTKGGEIDQRGEGKTETQITKQQ